MSGKFSRIYPQGIPVKQPESIQFHRFTNKFLNSPELEEIYGQKFVSSNRARSFKISCWFLILYFLFTSPNFVNLFSDDPDVVVESKLYCLMVFPVLIPIPFLLYISLLEKFSRYFHLIYSTIILCWAFSFLAGGMHSMLSEWHAYVSSDVVKLMKFLNYSQDLTTEYVLNSDLDICDCNWWTHAPVKGVRHEVFFYYLGNILLPAATMNINLLRLIMVFVITPMLNLDTIHYSLVVTVVSISYCILTLIIYPTTDSPQFITNRTLVLFFPVIFSIVMLLRTYDFDRIMRLDFLHVWSVERAAIIANRQKEMIADENKQLKAELATQRNNNETLIDLDSPVAKILSDLKTLQIDSDLSTGSQNKIAEILFALSRLDANLFTPDINAQMNSNAEFDSDTKSWAMSVLGHNKYSRRPRRSASPPLFGRPMDLENVSPTLLPNVVPIESGILKIVIGQIETTGWDLDTIALTVVTNNRPLYYTMVAIFEMHSLFDKCGVSRGKFYNFMFTLDQGYLDNSYHNSTHAADVAMAMNYLISNLSKGKIGKMLTDVEFFAALTAAAMHDYKHPGKSNLFMVKTQNDLALQFSDSSVLERMHLAESFLLTKNEDCNIFSGLDEKKYREVRKVIIEMVMSTDLSMHLQLVGNLKTAMLSEQKEDIVNDPMMMMKVVIKCADIGHSAKIRHLHGLWSSLIIEEFFLQGDDERESNLAISPFMDRTNENSAKNQVGFFEFIVLPFYETVATAMFDAEFAPIMENVRDNYRLWKYAANMEMTSIDTIYKTIFDADSGFVLED